MDKSLGNLLIRFKRHMTLGLCCVMAAGLFIWFKLRLVTGMPRSAYAVPDQVEPKAKTENADPNAVKPETKDQKAPAKAH